MMPDVEILEGAVDMHVHAKPDLHPRLMDELEILKNAKQYGMRGIVSKSHYSQNADRAAVINSMIDGVECFGGIVLNPPVGGLNPSAVDTAIRFGGKEVWMPSLYSRAHFEKVTSIKGMVRGFSEAISITHEGKLLPQVQEILDLIAEANVILGTSHCSSDEIHILVRKAFNSGVKKVIVTHPYSTVPNLPLKDQEELTKLGAYLELCLYTAMPISARVSMADFAKTIRTVGAERVVLGSDFGQLFHTTPAEGMRMFCNGLLAMGIDRRDIQIMVKENPSYLLDL